MRETIAIAMLASCATQQPIPNGAHASAWSVGRSDSVGVPDAVVCSDVVSHPCPWLLYTHVLLVEGDSVTWTAADGGADANGVPAGNRPDVVEQAASGDDGALAMPDRGDDGGLRHAFTLSPTLCGGWEADVTWNLFTVAGRTTFHLEVSP